ncbi:uncharacterized protein LOC143766488 isoform X4 [Ranitomeya variabilis]|uniref:uncharacterized protein LOC143766488 isoform X4 n=1 Tax=Ranitomeya variabilis TaxID=490064 RepID=UPI004056155B
MSDSLSLPPPLHVNGLYNAGLFSSPPPSLIFSGSRRCFCAVRIGSMADPLLEALRSRIDKEGSQPQHDSTLVTHAHVTHSHERRHDRRKRRRSYSASSSSPHSRRSHRTSDQHRRRSVHSHRRSSSRRYANSRSSRRRSPSSSYEMSSESASPDREIGPARVRRESQAASRVYSPVEQCAPPGASSQGLNFSSSSAGAGVPPSMGVPPPVVGSGFQEQFSQRSTGGLALPPFSLGNSGEQLMPLVRSSVVPSTWQSYGKAWEEWCSLIRGRPVHLSDQYRLQVTIEFISQLLDKGISGSSAQQRLSGLAFYFQLLGWVDVTKTFLIRQALKGWKRVQPSRECRRPISLSLLHTIICSTNEICSSHFESLLLSAAFGLAFFGALRISELVPQSKSSLEGGLLCDDVVLVKDSLRLRLRKSKTDPAGRGTWLLLHRYSGQVCPVLLIIAYLEVRRFGRFFLVHLDGSPLTRYQFQALFSKCLTASGVPVRDYGTHSFRIGAATEAAKAGLPDSEVQRIGRWRSACFSRYIRPDLLI